MSHQAIHVMVGILTDPTGRVLIAKRPEQVHQGGRWEFPGGKLKPTETPEQGLARELAEELGIEVRSSRPLIRVTHAYEDRRVCLDVRRVLAYTGVATGREGQPLAWQYPEELDPAVFPAADRPIMTALRLPPYLLITGDDPGRPDAFLNRLTRALHNGIQLVQLRAHDLDDESYRRLAGGAYAVCKAHGARLVLNRDPARVADEARHGLHLTAARLALTRVRPGGAGDWVSASCHTVADLSRAAELGLDYAVLSPVQRTASHPLTSPLGWQGFAAWIEPVSLPVYALGGLTAADLSIAYAHGAQGIAAIRSLWPRD